MSYADDITLSCPSIWGLNDILKICERFSVENSILFDKIFYNVVHLGNYINSACNDDVDRNIKKYFLIGYVNKLMTNYGRLQTSVLINLFKSYCCSVYGSHL